MLLFASRDQLRGMLETNHHIRTEDTDDRWEEYHEFQAMIEAELIVLCVSKAARGEAEKLQGEMVVAHDRYLEEFEGLSRISARWLGRLEKSFQFLLLCQSMLQSLIILMLGRNGFIFFGAVGAPLDPYQKPIPNPDPNPSLNPNSSPGPNPNPNPSPIS